MKRRDRSKWAKCDGYCYRKYEGSAVVLIIRLDNHSCPDVPFLFDREDVFLLNVLFTEEPPVVENVGFGLDPETNDGADSIEVVVDGSASVHGDVALLFGDIEVDFGHSLIHFQRGVIGEHHFQVVHRVDRHLLPVATLTQAQEVVEVLQWLHRELLPTGLLRVSLVLDRDEHSRPLATSLPTECLPLFLLLLHQTQVELQVSQSDRLDAMLQCLFQFELVGVVQENTRSWVHEPQKVVVVYHTIYVMKLVHQTYEVVFYRIYPHENLESCVEFLIVDAFALYSWKFQPSRHVVESQFFYFMAINI